MLNNLNQPKGSTIGVLRDGRTVQEAFDSLMYTEVLLKTGKENAESNRAALQAAAAVLQFPAGTLVRPSSQYAIKVTAKCSSGSETLTLLLLTLRGPYPARLLPSTLRGAVAVSGSPLRRRRYKCYP